MQGKVNGKTDKYKIFINFAEYFLMKMKILYDHQIFSLQKYGGISRYFAEIISHINGAATEIALKYSANVNLPKPKPFFVKEKKYYKLNEKISIEALKKQDFDIFHSTYYDDYFLDFIENKPFVITVHDMIHELYPEILSEPHISVMKQNLAKKAAHIIAVSEQTKKDIIDIFNIPENKISVIYHSTSLKKGKELNLPDNYILYVGQRQGYKNFLFFVYAIAPILRKRQDLFVVCTGCPFTEKETKILEFLDIKDRFICVFVSDDELFSVYNKAAFFVFPSYYEGFGIPVLEAFESSCPVILSDLACFREIADDSAIFFPPKNMKKLRESIETLIDDGNLRKQLIAKGRERKQIFSWELSAKQTVEVYERILNEKKL
jgi:glycosyltransferase involved in cell wall biosynthesis